MSGNVSFIPENNHQIQLGFHLIATEVEKREVLVLEPDTMAVGVLDGRSEVSGAPLTVVWAAPLVEVWLAEPAD